MFLEHRLPDFKSFKLMCISIEVQKGKTTSKNKQTKNVDVANSQRKTPFLWCIGAPCGLITSFDIQV